MNRLNGKTLYIGREDQNNRLLVGVEINGRPSVLPIGNPGIVPDSVSRFIPTSKAADRAHCKVDIDDQGRISITNLKQMNTTFVNGVAIHKKIVEPNSTVTLGYQQFPVDLPGILKAVAEKLPQPPASIRHLEQVWENYKSRLDYIKRRQQSLNLLRSISPVFTIGAGVVSGIIGAGSKGTSSPLFFMTTAMSVLGLAIMIYSFIKTKKFDSIALTDEATEELQRNYVCPRCGYILPAQPYKVLSHNFKKCPGCKCDFSV